MKVLLKNIRSGKRKAKLLDLTSITRKQLEKDLDTKVKPALIKSHQLVVSNWEHKINFGTKKFITGDSISMNIFPTGENAKIYTFVDQGTRAHKIRAKNKPRLAFQAGVYVSKTLAKPARTVSGGGRVEGGHLVRPVEVNHPGSEGRHFSETIGKDIQPDFVRTIENSFRVVSKAVEE